MSVIDFTAIVRDAWAAFDPSTPALGIEDISAQVSTNHVYKVTLASRRFVVGKVSYFGKYEHFCEDHTIINTLAKTLQPPYTRLLARSLRQQGEVFTYRQKGGHMTANGEAFNPKGLSAAHKHLPLPTFVQVTNLSNNRRIIVRVNDRGPFVDGRIIDLSAGAAKKLGFYKQGTTRVLVETVQVEG